MNVLIDKQAFLYPAVWMAALREYNRESPVHLYAVFDADIEPWSVLRWAYQQPKGSVHVLTTPDRAGDWRLINDDDVDVDLFLLTQWTGIDRTKARGWLKKYGSLVAINAEKHKGYEERIFRAQKQLQDLSTSAEWKPEWISMVRVEVGQPGRNYVALTEDTAEEALRNLISTPGPVSLDFETEGDYPLGLTAIGFSFSTAPGSATYVPLRHADGPNVSVGMGQRFLAHISGREWIAHNAKFEFHVLINEGIPADRITLPDDTMVMSWLLGGERGLKTLAADVLNQPMTTFEEVTRGNKDKFSHVPVHRAVGYGCADSDMSLRLRERFLQDPAFASVSRLYEEVERPLMPVLSGMERRGLGVDLDWLASWKGQLEEEMAELEERFWTQLDLPLDLRGNLNSDKYVQWLLFEHLGLEPQRFTTEGYSVDEATIRVLLSQHPSLETLLGYREKDKLRGTYAVGLSERAHLFSDGRIHPQFDGTGTRFGRLSSKSPNGQNVPLVARHAVKSADGKRFVGADYGQIELRIIAHLSADPALVDAFERGISPHMVTLEKMFGLTDKGVSPEKYKICKNVNFGSVYGIGPDTLCDTLRKEGVYLSRGDAAKYLEDHQKAYPRFYQYQHEIQEQVLYTGETRTIQGKIIKHPGVFSSDPAEVAAALREAFNSIVQGSAGIGTKTAMVAVEKHIPQTLALNVHDELVLEVDAHQASGCLGLLEHLMKNSIQLNVPVEVEGNIAERWSRLK